MRFGGIEETAEEIKDQLGEYYDELIDVYNDKETQLSGLTFSDPVDFAEVEEKTVSVGDTFFFEATDLDGNKVSSTDLFSGHRITMINVWATWCGPCKMVGPIVAEIAEEYEGKVKVGKVNVDEEPQLAMQFKVTAIPTLFVFKNGEVDGQIVGFGIIDTCTILHTFIFTLFINGIWIHHTKI